MLLSIIIVNWNAKCYLERCLTTVYASSLASKEYEIILIDNNSSDDSVNSVTSKFPHVNVYVNNENIGFSRGANQGIKKSNGKYLLLLNPDTEIETLTLEVMINFIENSVNCGIAGCRVLNSDGSLQLACRRNIPTPLDAFYKLTGLSMLFPNSPHFSRYNLTCLPPEKITSVTAVSGSFLLIRRKAIDKIGLLDERFFLYGEDLDWCLRAKLAGYEIFYVPLTSIVHHRGKSSKIRPFRSAYYFYQAMYVFYCKHNAPRWSWPFVWFAAMFGFVTSIPKIFLRILSQD